MWPIMSSFKNIFGCERVNEPVPFAPFFPDLRTDFGAGVCGTAN
jgi:hypothetical protein